MSLGLSELQTSDRKAQKIRASSLDRYKEVDEVLHRHELLFVHEIIQIKLISQYPDNLLARHFGFDKISKLIARKYY